MITGKNDKQLIRTPRELEPLIKEDLKRLKEAEKDTERNILMPIRIAIGGKLTEAKSAFTYSEFSKWVKNKFRISVQAAHEWMRIASHETTVSFTSVTDFRRATQPSYAGNPTGTSHVRVAVDDALKRLKVENYNHEIRMLSVSKERDLERKLALELINIGYKVLSVKLHPDKGGSHDAMSRLNNVRKRLRGAA